MVNRHHIAVLDLSRHRILVQPSPTHPLPSVATTGRTRLGVWLPGWLADHGVHGCLLWSWLGKANTTLTLCDWLIVATGDSRDVPQSPFQWRDLDLAGDPIDGYQRMALHAVRQAATFPGVFGPYADPGIWPSIEAFVERVAGAARAQAASPLRRRIFKVTPRRLVAGYSRDAAGGRCVYVKGSVERTSNEKDVLTSVNAALPNVCPEVLASDDLLGLQLLDEAGSPVGNTTDTATLDRVMTAFADLQYHWTGARPRVPSVPTLTCDALRQVVLNFLLLGSADSAESTQAIQAFALRTLHRLGDCEYPLSLIHIDPTTNNIRMDAHGVRFIDWENAIVAPAPLGCELILARFERANPSWPAALSARSRATYAARWNELAPGFRAFGEDLRLLAQIMVAAIHWRVLCERVETGDWSGPLDLVWAQGIRRLSKALPAAALTV